MHANTSVRNNCRPLDIFRPISTFAWLKSILIGRVYCIFSMGQQSLTYKIFYLMYCYRCDPTRVNSIHAMVICRHLIVLISLYTHFMCNQIYNAPSMKYNIRTEY